MHVRRLVCVLLGAWMGGSLFMTTVATQNFRSVDRLLAQPPQSASIIIQEIGHDAARSLLRYEVSEQNRFYFTLWEWIQLGLGVAVLGSLLFGTHERAFMILSSALMLLIVLVMRFSITPDIISLGRAIDFVSAAAPSGARTRFWRLHGVYSAMEVVKLLIGIALIIKLVMGSRRESRHIGKNFNLVDVPHHRHVDG
jgi:hypothetical protein